MLQARFIKGFRRLLTPMGTRKVSLPDKRHWSNELKMADQPDRTPNIYALLRLYKNLKGCFRDINLVADYLLKTLKIPSEKMFKLTSPNPEVTQTIETKDPEPTYENIVAQFHAITEIAQPGEQVYIQELKGNDQQDEGIVPMDVGNEGGRYLRDVELTTLLKRMTDKGLIVTVIMDSCHSGEATRGDDVAIRGMVEIDTAPRDSESLVAPRQECKYYPWALAASI